MNDFAFLRFLTNGLLNEEEKRDKETNIMPTEEILHAHGMECDATIAMSEKQLEEILEKAGPIRRQRKKERKVESSMEREVVHEYCG